jgi:hypothetical protein
MGDAAADKDWRIATTMTSPSGSLLPVPLGLGAIDLTAGLGLMSALTRVGQLAHQCLVHQVGIDWRFEHTGREFDLANLLAGHIAYCNLHRYTLRTSG